MNGGSSMKLGFPVEINHGLESEVYGHFGSAPAFVVVDTDSDQIVALENGNRNHQHGSCNPVMALQGQKIDAMIVGGIGPGALRKLNAMGIRVFGAGTFTIRDNISLWKGEGLRELSMNDSCHAHQGECSH
jgi:predicted Fe-Mo cluster-binding NifX family protein